MQLMLTPISEALIQIMAVLKFAFERIIIIIFFHISILQKQPDNFMLVLLDKVKEEIFIK